MALQSNSTKAYVSAIDSMLDTREINKLVTDIQNEDQLTDILDLAGKTKPTKQPVYYNFVNESLFKLGDTTGATVTGSGTATVQTTFTIATSGVVKKGDLVLFPTGSVVGQVQTVSTGGGQDTVTIKSVGGGNITHTAAEKLAINFSFASGENSVSPTNVQFGLTKYSNKVQIFRETSKITDVQNAATIEVEFNGKPSFIVKDHIEKALLLKGKINAAFIGGDMSATSFSDASPSLTDQYTLNGDGGGAVQTTRGIDKYISSYGVTAQVGSLGTVAIADVNTFCDALTAARAPMSYTVLGSKATLRAYDIFWKNLGSSGVTSARLLVDGKEIDIPVQKVTYGGYEFNYGRLPILDHPNIFSQTPIAKSAYYIPMDKKVKVLGGDYQSAIQVRYFPKQSIYGNDMINESHDGALSPVNPNGQGQYFRMDYVTTQGIEVLGAQFFGRHRVLS